MARSGTKVASANGNTEGVKLHPSRPGLPSYWYVYPAIGLEFLFLWWSGWWVYFIPYFIVYCAICPFVSWPHAIGLMLRSLRPYPGFDWYVNLNGLAMVLSRFLVLWPIETLLWHADAIFFPGYRTTPVNKPLFVIGQPRSGTTKLENILSHDPRLVSLTLFEMRYPYITVFYLKDAVASFDAKYLGGAIKKFIYKNHLNYFMSATSERCKMRPLRYDKPDEDDTIFLFHQSMHFTLLGPFPAVEYVKIYYHFDALPTSEQTRMMAFHKAAVQKVMYYRGEGKVYFSKWVGGWNGQLQISDKLFYPDAQYLCIVREPSLSLPSWMRLQSLLSEDFVGIDILSNPDIVREIKKENAIWFKNQIEFCNSLSRDRLLTFSSEAYYEHIRDSTHQLYKHLGVPITPEFDEFLANEDRNQKEHVPTKTDERHITLEEIRRDFPDLPRELITNKAGVSLKKK